MKHKSLFISVLSLILASCASSSHGSRVNPIASLFEKENQESQQTLIESSEQVEDTSVSIEQPTYETVDIDLTEMNSTMVYSQVLNMLDYPSQYIDQIIKMNGPFRPFPSTNPDYCYPAIVIQDATACCASGIEFLLYGVPRCSMDGGNGYPLYDEEATIVGRFETYLEGTDMYIHLVDAIWIKDA